MSQALPFEGQLDFGWKETETLNKGVRREARPRPVAARNLCAACRARKAFLRRPAPGRRSLGEGGRTLCFRCYHAELQSAREARAAAHSTLIVERRTRPLSGAEVAHRQQMLEHLRHQAQIGARRAVGD